MHINSIFSELSLYGSTWAKALEKEVRDECHAKYGPVVHISVDPSSEGDVYVKFDSVTGGENALKGLNGRNFNYRTIRASFVVDKIYSSLFGAAADKF
jgi:RNA-binding protein 23/39